MRACARLLSLIVISGTVALLPTAAQAAVGITRAELQGTQLRVEGNGALPSHAVTVNPGGVTGTSDGSGAFRIEASGYSSPTCKVSVTDGASTMTAQLAGCTPATTTPPPPVVSPPPPVVTPPPSTTGPAAVLTPASLTFPAETTGTPSPTQVATLTNPGTATLFINAISPRGVAALDFNIVDDQCVGTNVLPGHSCTLTVQFTPTADGSRPSTYAIVDNAANSPQVLTVTGTGLGSATGPTPLTIATAGLPCAGGVCDVSAGFSFTVGNFYAGLFQATGGTAPYTYSAVTPPGLSFTTAGLLSGVLPTVGTFPFSVTVRDSATPTASTTVLFSMKVTAVPPPSPPGCQQGSTVRAALTGAPIGGRTPSGQAQENESQLTACGGFGILTVSVSNVNLPNGTVLWVYLDSQAVGTITLSGGGGSIRPYNLGRVGLRFDSITINNGPPPTVLAQPSVLSGGSFH